MRLLLILVGLSLAGGAVANPNIDRCERAAVEYVERGFDLMREFYRVLAAYGVGADFEAGHLSPDEAQVLITRISALERDLRLWRRTGLPNMANCIQHGLPTGND